MTHEKLQISTQLLKKIERLGNDLSTLKTMKDIKGHVELLGGLTTRGITLPYDEVKSLIGRKMKKIEQEIQETQKAFNDL